MPTYSDGAFWDIAWKLLKNNYYLNFLPNVINKINVLKKNNILFESQIALYTRVNMHFSFHVYMPR